jgi:hypothetical protein
MAALALAAGEPGTFAISALLDPTGAPAVMRRGPARLRVVVAALWEGRFSYAEIRARA